MCLSTNTFRSLRDTSPIFCAAKRPVRLRDTAGGESQNAVQKNKCIRCYPTLVFLYICRISEAVRHSQAENVIFACLCALLSLYLQQIRRQTTVISNHPTLCTTCRLSYILPCKTQGRRLNALLSHYLSNEMDRARPSPLPYHVISRGATLAI